MRVIVSGVLLALTLVGELVGRLFGRRPRSRRRPEAPPVRAIEARQPGLWERVREFWAYRSLLTFFGRRYVQKMYIRTWLGWLWLPLRPLLSVGARVLVFGGVLKIPSDGLPYLLFFLVGMSAWELFASTTFWATRSIELNRGILRRIYVPRLTALVAAIAPSSVNYGIYLCIVAVAVAGYWLADGVMYVDFEMDLLVALLGLLLMLLLALGIGLWTSVYAAQARDVRFGLGYVLSFWFFLTPVIYPVSAVPDSYRAMVYANPMTAPIEMVKYGILGTSWDVPDKALVVTGVSVLLVGMSGLWFFSRSEAAALDSL
jgi:lipopolysaccharide transport system permease protein